MRRRNEKHSARKLYVCDCEPVAVALSGGARARCFVQHGHVIQRRAYEGPNRTKQRGGVCG